MRKDRNDNFNAGKSGRSRRARVLPVVTLALALLLSACQGLPLMSTSLSSSEPGASAAPSVIPLESRAPVLPRPVLHAYSTNRDLLILVTDASGAAILDTVFPLSVEYPHGVGFGMETGKDGSLYLKDLTPGEYRLRMDGTDGYSAAEPIAAEVIVPSRLYGDSVNSGWRTEDGRTFFIGRGGRAYTGLRSVDGKEYYFNIRGEKAKALGIDVSFYNKGICWPLVRARGIDFAIIRAAYRGWETGILHEDSRFRQNIVGAKAAGMKIGVYIYSTAVNAEEAAAEASMVLELLNGMQLDLPVFLDTEQSGDYPDGRADRLSKVRRTEILNAFCHCIERGGSQAGVYSGQNFFKRHIHYGTVTEYMTWLASYTTDNQLPDFPYPYDMWQFTDSGTVSGIRGIVDMNAVY